MSAIITNFSAPDSYKALTDCYREGGSNLALLFDDCSKGYTIWSASRKNVVGDIVFFSCAATSMTKIAHARIETKNMGDNQLIAYADKEYALYKKYAGKLLAFGIVSGTPYLDTDGRYYAEITDLQRLTHPIPYSEYKSFITLNPGGAITTLKVEQETKLLALVEGDYKAEPFESQIEVNDPSLTEGRRIETYGTKYERNPRVRAAFLAQCANPYKCAVCGFDFEKAYGDLGKGFIEVHHIKPLSSVGTETAIDPKKDLVSLCSNCHRMIHRGGILNVDELRTIMMNSMTETREAHLTKVL